MSAKHLQRYVDELSFRYNTVNLTDCYRFEEAINKSDNARLRYKDLIGDGRKKRKKESFEEKGLGENKEENSRQERFRSEAEFRSDISS
jgi:hypothetical protein